MREQVGLVCRTPGHERPARSLCLCITCHQVMLALEGPVGPGGEPDRGLDRSVGHRMAAAVVGDVVDGGQRYDEEGRWPVRASLSTLTRAYPALQINRKPSDPLCRKAAPLLPPAVVSRSARGQRDRGICTVHAALYALPDRWVQERHADW